MNSSLREQFKVMASQTYDRTAIQAAPDLRPGDEHPSIVEVQNYLKHYGYLAQDAAPTPGQIDDTTVNALTEFQQRFNIETSGNLDTATRAAMSASRCGVPDIVSPLAFNTIGAWNRRNLTYAFGIFSNQIGNDIAQNAILRAFNTWAAAGIGLIFTEVAQNQNPDIFIEWRQAADSDHSMVGGVLAHADFPPGFSIIVNNLPLPLHYDDQEHTWVDGAVLNGFDIETIALHEIGHCLGLLHTDVNGSVMFPTVSPNLTLRVLQADDLTGIRNLYPPLNPFPNWQLLDNNPASVDIVADGNDLYQLHNNGLIWKLTGPPMTGWQLFDNNPATKKIVAAGGNLYQLHQNGLIWKLTGAPMTGWQLFDNNPATVDIVADGNDLYQLHNNGLIWKLTGPPMTGWQLFDNNPATKKIVAAGGNLYQLHQNGLIWKLTGAPMTGWQLFDNNPATVDIVADGNDLYQLHNNGLIWKLTGPPMTGWQLFDNNPATKKIVAAGGNLYQLHQNGLIWKLTGAPMTGWQLFDNNPASVNIIAASNNLYQIHNNGFIWKHTG